MATNTVKAKGKDSSFWIIVILVIVYSALVIAYATQTWDLVEWLFPPTNVFMKISTVFSFDGMALMWAAVDMFYQFYKRRSKTVAQGMWYLSFGLATIASAIQMYISSTTRLDFTVDTNLISLAYLIVIVALTANIIALTWVLRLEHGARYPSVVIEEVKQEEEEEVSTPVDFQKAQG